MIKKFMSQTEILNELKSIDANIKSHIPGYLKKFSQKLNSPEYGHNDVLSVREYWINGNKVIICFQKFVITDELPKLRITHIVVTEDNGAFIMCENEWDKFCFHHFSKHAIDRMWERTGLTLKNFFVNEFVKNADTAFHLEKYYEHGYNDYTYIMTIGKCFFIVYKCTNKIEVGTVLEWDRLHYDQKRLYLDSMRSAYEFADKKYYNIADSLKGTGFKKTNYAVSGLCGYSSVAIAG